jgi:NADH:ubiquinone oxidoreductase subunit 6 (subunit J)
MTIIFFASAAVAMIAALVAVVSRDSMRSLAGFAVAVAAVIVPLVQLRAPLVAGVLLVATAVSVLLLGALARLRGSAGATASGRSPVYAVLAGAGLLGFVWVLLATGSRQVVESGPPLTPGNAFGDSSALLLELADTQLVAGLVVGLLALCCVIAAVLTLVGEGVGGREGGTSS